MKPKTALELLYSEFDPSKLKTEADFIGIKFDLDEEDFDAEVKRAVEFVKNLKTDKPLILKGVNNHETDLKLLPLLCELAPKGSVIAFAEEQTYEAIVPHVVKYGHSLVLRTPIDINLAKELNILAHDTGLPLDKIYVDPDMGGLGYGLEYGYSIIERIKQAALDGDSMLDMPIIAFIGEESARAKEAKADTFSPEWGEFEERKVMWEISGASAIAASGANLVVLRNEESVKALKGILC